jgi:hypothetical protein
MARLRKLASLASAIILFLGELIGGLRKFVHDMKPAVEYSERLEPPGDHVQESVLANNNSREPAAILDIFAVPPAEDEAPLYLVVARRSLLSVNEHHADDWFELA